MQIHILRLSVTEDDSGHTIHSRRVFLFSPHPLEQKGADPPQHCFVSCKSGSKFPHYVTVYLKEVPGNAPGKLKTFLSIYEDMAWEPCAKEDVPPAYLPDAEIFTQHPQYTVLEAGWAQLSVPDDFLEEFARQCNQPVLHPPSPPSQVPLWIAAALLALYLISALYLRRWY